MRYLDLQDSQIGDAQVKALSMLTQVKNLHVKRSKLTAAGIKELAAALPKCGID